MGAKTEAWLHQRWASKGLFAWSLSPLSILFHLISQSRRQRTVANRLSVPVVVVGNIYVGGTGKTPVTIALVKELQKRGWTPGIISRGYGRTSAEITLVNDKASVAHVGDEPLLIHRETNAPVCVGQNRYEAGKLLLEKHPEIDLILSDDGLQHHALHRDVELAVVGARGLGNGWVLPAGPLREGPSRLDTVDAIILNTSNEAVVKSRTPRFAASSCFGTCTQLATGKTLNIDDLAQKIEDNHLNVVASAGIAAPERFFAMVRAHDINAKELPLSDHFDFQTNPFASLSEEIILITAKDAVKCIKHPELSKDTRLWIVSLEMHLDRYLIDLIERKLHSFPKKHA